MHDLARARTRVRLAGHILLGVQTNRATSDDGMLEGLALERHMSGAWTADSFLNIMLSGLPARSSIDFLPSGRDLFIRTFRTWDDCASCTHVSTRNNMGQRSAINFITPDACKSLSDRTLHVTHIEEETRGTLRQLNILKVYEHRLNSIVWHPTEKCPVCQEGCTESWITNTHQEKPPPFLLLAFPDQPVLPSVLGQPLVLFADMVTSSGNRRGPHIKYQLLHVIQKNAGHYRDVGIEEMPTALEEFPIFPWVMNDNMHGHHSGVEVPPPILHEDRDGFRPVLAVYYCTSSATVSP
jgi:hypothetical protein